MPLCKCTSVPSENECFFSPTRALVTLPPPTFATKVSGAHTTMLLGGIDYRGARSGKQTTCALTPYLPLLVLINGISAANNLPRRVCWMNEAGERARTIDWKRCDDFGRRHCSEGKNFIIGVIYDEGWCHKRVVHRARQPTFLWMSKMYQMEHVKQGRGKINTIPLFSRHIGKGICALFILLWFNLSPRVIPESKRIVPSFEDIL